MTCAEVVFTVSGTKPDSYLQLATTKIEAHSEEELQEMIEDLKSNYPDLKVKRRYELH